MRMLSFSAHKWEGCCAKCARGRNRKPAPSTRRNARAVEKRAWKKDIGR